MQDPDSDVGARRSPSLHRDSDHHERVVGHRPERCRAAPLAGEHVPLGETAVPDWLVVDNPPAFRTSTSSAIWTITMSTSTFRIRPRISPSGWPAFIGREAGTFTGYGDARVQAQRAAADLGVRQLGPALRGQNFGGGRRRTLLVQDRRRGRAPARRPGTLRHATAESRLRRLQRAGGERRRSRNGSR